MMTRKILGSRAHAEADGGWGGLSSCRPLFPSLGRAWDDQPSLHQISSGKRALTSPWNFLELLSPLAPLPTIAITYRPGDAASDKCPLKAKGYCPKHIRTKHRTILNIQTLSSHSMQSKLSISSMS